MKYFQLSRRKHACDSGIINCEYRIALGHNVYNAYHIIAHLEYVGKTLIFKCFLFKRGKQCLLKILALSVMAGIIASKDSIIWLQLQPPVPDGVAIPLKWQIGNVRVLLNPAASDVRSSFSWDVPSPPQEVVWFFSILTLTLFPTAMGRGLQGGI